MSEQACGSPNSAGTDKCAVNMGIIHLQAGDLVSAYRFFLPLAEAGDQAAMQQLAEISERGGDSARAESWRQRAATSPVVR